MSAAKTTTGIEKKPHQSDDHDAAEAEHCLSSDLLQELDTCFKDIKENTPKMKAKKFKPRFKLFREFVLSTLSCLVKDRQGKGWKDKSTVSCEEMSPQMLVLDAVAGAGVSGLQWKRHFGSDIHLTFADHDDINLISSNAALNSLKATVRQLDPTRVQGDSLCAQDEDEVHTCQVDAKAFMMMESFKFIYLHPPKNITSYMDAVSNSISGDGVACLVVSDISLFARSPNLTRRYYSADFLKTSYLKELAARIVLANIAVSAARCNKGIKPLYVVYLEDCLLVCAQFLRGNKASDSSLSYIRQLLHCRMCEEKAFLPSQMAPIEEPYSLLPCSCKSLHPGKTAVILGPLWQGHLFESSFLSQMMKQGNSLHLSPEFVRMTSLLTQEGCCSSSPHLLNRSTQQTPLKKDNEDVFCKETISVNSFSDNESEESLKNQCDGSSALGKRKLDNDTEVESVKYAKLASLENKESVETVNVPFYHNVSKLKGGKVPKTDRLVTCLQSLKFNASRTHFEPTAIRTSATLKQFIEAAGKC